MTFFFQLKKLRSELKINTPFAPVRMRIQALRIMHGLPQACGCGMGTLAQGGRTAEQNTC